MNSIPILSNEETLGGVIILHGGGKDMFEACAYMYTYACIKYARMTKTFGKQTKENRITCNPATTTNHY